MIKIVYFARLREVFKTGEENVMLPGHVTTVGGVRAWLAERGATWRQEMLESPALCVAVNHDYATDESSVAAGDEIGFFPPVTGG